MEWSIHPRETTGSTNDDARQLAMEGAPEGTVVTAECQSSGRGRRGSQWVSPPGRNLICSVILRPDFPLEYWSRLTHAASVAICEALEELGLKPQIKWPNDIYLSERKVCGILLETAGNARGMFVVIGFGLNVNLRLEEFPDELGQSATSLLIETERTWNREELLQSILFHLGIRCRMVAADFAQLLAMAETRSFLTGHRVTLGINDVEQEGFARGLSSEGGLLFENTSGDIRTVLSADLVRRAKPAGNSFL